MLYLLCTVICNFALPAVLSLTLGRFLSRAHILSLARSAAHHFGSRQIAWVPLI
jgi:hypothetical protein